MTLTRNLKPMQHTHRPRIRSLELVPLTDGDGTMFALRDPLGFAGTVALPRVAAMLVRLMNGKRTLGELRQAFQQKVGKSLTLPEVERVVNQLDEQHFLENDRFAAHEAAMIAEYQALDVRPAAHAGSAYPSDPDALRELLDEMFTGEGGPGMLPREGHACEEIEPDQGRRLCGVMSPHIDFHRGGSTIAWAYDRVVTESDATLFVILGTAHTPLKSVFSVSRKHFDTPLGRVETDRKFIDALAKRVAWRGDASVAERMLGDEFPHRSEHSIEFQALLLQYVLAGRRDFQIVPLLVDSFQPFVQQGQSPDESLEVAALVAALRETVAADSRNVCFIAGVDLAHIGKQFGDKEPLDKARLREQWTDDQQLLATACASDAAGWFEHVARQQDKNRICGLAPAYTMLEAMTATRGELLKYDQAVADDGSSCVSFASAAFYE